MNNNEKIIVEVITSMLQQDSKLGLAFHDKKKSMPDESNSFQTMHEQINEMFNLKSIDLTHHEGIMAAFHRTHNYKYISDPTFQRSFEKSMKAQGIPTSEMRKSLEIVNKIIKELGTEDIEQDYGFNPDLDKIIDVSKPGEK